MDSSLASIFFSVERCFPQGRGMEGQPLESLAWVSQGHRDTGSRCHLVPVVITLSFTSLDPQNNPGSWAGQEVLANSL